MQQPLESRLAEAEARVKEADQKAKVIWVALKRLKWGISNLSHPKSGAASSTQATLLTFLPNWPRISTNRLIVPPKRS